MASDFPSRLIAKSPPGAGRAARPVAQDAWGGLMVAAQDGHGAAYRRLLAEISVWLTRYFERRLPPGDVDDAVQETLMAVHRRRHTYDPGYPLGAWLAAIAKRKWIDQLRSLARRRTKELSDDIAVRFAVSAAWVALAFALGRSVPLLAAIMLVAYPAWDALANYLDAGRSGGLTANKTLLLNFIVSLVTAVAVAATLEQGMHDVLKVFGIWASLSGLLQLATGIRRWKSSGAQWAMILSGAQSGLAGVFMLKRAAGIAPVGIADIAPYAAFGAFYFLVSAVSLAIADAADRTVNHLTSR